MKSSPLLSPPGSSKESGLDRRGGAAGPSISETARDGTEIVPASLTLRRDEKRPCISADVNCS